MIISKTWQAIVGAVALGVAANASAVPVTFDLADGPQSSVAITSLDKNCLIGSCGASVSLNANLDSLSKTLSAGQSWAFDFFSINFYGLGTGSGTLAASLGFDAPTTAPNAVGSGNGSFLSAFFFSAGSLNWITQPGTFSLADGTSYSVVFQDLVGITVGTTATVKALLTLNAEPTGVPEPGTLALFGLGLLGLGFARKVKRQS
jgi:hypothetical protein